MELDNTILMSREDFECEKIELEQKKLSLQQNCLVSQGLKFFVV
jgi:hypothetical protein